MRHLLFCVLFLVSFSNSGFSKGNHISRCQPRGSDLIGGCTFVTYSMSTQTLWPHLPSFMATFVATYNYICEGHEIDIGFRSGSSFVKFERGGTRTATLDSMGIVDIIDRNPSFTKNSALFKTGCVFEILSLTMEPATSTLAALADQARSQAKIIDMSVQLFRMGQSWERLASWSQNELSQMKEELTLLRDISDSPEDLDKLLKVIDLAIAGSPLPPDLGQSDNNVATLKNFLLEKLNKEIESGQAILKMYSDFQRVANQDLEVSVQKARSVNSLQSL